MADLEKKTVETPEVDASVEKAETPRGRAGVLAKFQKGNPDFQGEPSEEDLWNFAGSDYDGVKGQFNELNGANSRLAELVASDPRLGAVLAMIAGEKPKSLPYAMGSIYGKDWIEGDPEEFEKGYQESLARLAESKAEQEKAAKNIQDYQANLEKFKADNELSDEEIGSLNDAIFSDAENFLMGIVPVEYIETKWKAMNYDADIQEAANTGVVEGRNQSIELKKKKITGEAPLPDLASGTKAGKNKPIPSNKKRSAYDGMEEVTV